MNGVEILNQTNIYETEGRMWIFWLILGVCIGIGLILAIKSCVDCGFDIECVFIVIVLAVIGLFFGAICYAVSIHDTDTLDYVKYQVTVSEEVNFSDFMDKYKILDQEGKIYTVKERE